METTLGQRLEEIRKERGMAKKKLAELLNVAESTITTYVQDTSIPPLPKLIRIKNLFHEYNWDWLTRGVGEKKVGESIASEPKAIYNKRCKGCEEKGRLIGQLNVIVGEQRSIIEDMKMGKVSGQAC